MTTLRCGDINAWKTVSVPLSAYNDDEDFQFLSQIEELSDYSVCRNETSPGVTYFEVKDNKRKITENEDKNRKNKKAKKLDLKIENTEAGTSADETELQADQDISAPADLLYAWSTFGLSDALLKALAEQNFTQPTPIQQQCLLPAIRDRLDILGAAETGSGKTLAFSLPIIQALLNNRANAKGIKALILTPTRELAIQIRNHIKSILKYTDLKVAVVVGGLSIQKQERLLKQKPHILVATPGRLWAMMKDGCEPLSRLSEIEYLVIDETDRMVEKGHFQELSMILDFLNSEENHRLRQTFVFSATLAFVHAPPKRLASKTETKKMTPKQKIEMLVSLTRLREQRKVIDLTKSFGTADSLTEARIICDTLEEKDTYLYYFLTNYPGRTLVFTNSIDCSRRLKNLLSRLLFAPLLLNAQMQQKQRLKNLEKFSESKEAILLATDVAARGLDIRNIDHVLHYQVPRTAEVYIHRSGRTARACKEGLSIMMVDGQDALNYRKICQTLNRDQDLPIFPVNHTLLAFLRQRIKLATKLESLEYRLSRLMVNKNWFSRAAADAELEDIEEPNSDDDDQERSAVLDQKRQIKGVTKSLNALLQKPLPRDPSFRTKYPTSLSKLPEFLDPKPAPNALETAKCEADKPKQKVFARGIRIKQTTNKKKRQFKRR